jgi:integrase
MSEQLRLLLQENAALRTQNEALLLVSTQQAELIKQQGVMLAMVKEAKGPAITVQEIYDAFEIAHKSAHSWKAMRNRLRPFVAAFGALPAMSVTPAMWAKYREKRKETISDKTDRAMSPLTINFELGWAKKMFTWASDPEQGLIPSNPLSRAKAEKVDSERDTWLTMVEVNKLLGHFAEILFMKVFLLVAISTGLRISEILRIRRDKIKRIELQDGRIIGLVELSKRRNKTKKTYYASIPPVGMAGIDEMPESVNPHILPSPYRPGRPYGARHIARMFRDGCEKTGIDYRAAEGDGHVRCHDVRHSAATLAAQNEATLPQVQRMLNHTTPHHTIRYLHFDESDAIEFALLMEKGLRKGPQRATPDDSALAQKKKSSIGPTD